MSSYDQIEKSVADSRPIEVYEFSAKTKVYRYTSAEDAIVVDGQTFASRVLVRDNVVSGGADRSRIINVALVEDDDLARLFVPTPPPAPVGVKITRLQRDETPPATKVVLFAGSIRGYLLERKNRLIRFQCVSLDSERSLTFPRDVYSALCNNQVYDRRCRANPLLHQFTGVCTAASTSQSGPTITVTDSGSSPHKFRGGWAQVVGSSDARMIIQQGVGLTVDDLTLITPFSEDPTGAVVTLTAGCDHQMQGDCMSVFDNVENFRGYAWVPTRNVFSVGLS